MTDFFNDTNHKEYNKTCHETIITNRYKVKTNLSILIVVWMLIKFPFSPGWDASEGEKAPFLRNEPVRLTPAWEGSNLPNDTLNLKGKFIC